MASRHNLSKLAMKTVQFSIIYAHCSGTLETQHDLVNTDQSTHMPATSAFGPLTALTQMLWGFKTNKFHLLTYCNVLLHYFAPINIMKTAVFKCHY